MRRTAGEAGYKRDEAIERACGNRSIAVAHQGDEEQATQLLEVHKGAGSDVEKTAGGTAQPLFAVQLDI